MSWIDLRRDHVQVDILVSHFWHSSAMASVGSVTRQIAALEISAKQNGATKQTRPINQKAATAQSNVSKLLTKFAAPLPFPDPKAKAASSVKAVPPRTAKPAAKQPAPAPAPASHSKPLDIGKYDGGFEIENEKRGEAVDGEAAQELALDSSVSR
jgi:aurora kinase